MANIDFEQGENKIDTWTMNYVQPSGGGYNGKLTITNKRLIFEAKFKLNIIGSADISPYAPNSLGFCVLPKDDILTVETAKNFLHKKIILIMKNGEKHTFDYGMLNIDKVAAAINQK